MMLAALGVDTSDQVLAATNAQTAQANIDLAAYVDRLASEIRSLGLTPTIEKFSNKATMFAAVDYYTVGIAEYGESASRLVQAGSMLMDPRGLAETMASDGRLGESAQQRAGQVSITQTPAVVVGHTESPSSQTTQQAVVSGAVDSVYSGMVDDVSESAGGFLQGNTLLLLGGAAVVVFLLFGRGR